MRFLGRKRIGTYNSLGVVLTGGGEEAEQVLSVKDDYVGVTTIDAQASRTGAGPEGPGTRPKAKPGSEVVRAGCTDLESICEPDGDPDALNLSNCVN